MRLFAKPEISPKNVGRHPLRAFKETMYYGSNKKGNGSLLAEKLRELIVGGFSVSCYLVPNIMT